MSTHQANDRSDSSRAGWFATTHWSVVLAAKADNVDQSVSALEKLCQTYWPPLYTYVRREGYSAEDAQDLTQEFLSRFVHKEWLNHLHDRRGKFRSFLLTFLKHFLSDERDRARALKRGGGQTIVPLDAWEAEERSAIEPAGGLSADQLYERRWARAVMDAAAARLRDDYLRRGKGEWYEVLKDLQPGEHGERTYAELAIQLNTTEQALKNAVHAFRKRYRELLRDEIAHTVADPADLEDEIQHLLRIFAQ